MSEQYNLKIENYLLIRSKNNKNGKKIMKKFNKFTAKTRMVRFFQSREFVNFENDFVKILVDYIISLKRFKMPNTIGILTEHNVFYLNNILTLPPPPVKWDILCLDSEVNCFDYTDKFNNIYWCKTNIVNTRNFVINAKSIEKVLSILKNKTTFDDFILQINKLDLYTVTQNHLSQYKSTWIEPPENNDCVNYSKETHAWLNTNIYKQVDIVNVKDMGAKFDKLTEKLNQQELEQLYPKISLICPLTDPKLIPHTVYSFLKIKYPPNKLQLVILDDTNSEKKLKMFLPQDTRIKLVNISKKDNDIIPLGYKLNTAIKYAKHDVLINFFDTNHYYISNFQDIVKTYILSKKDAVMSIDNCYLRDNNSEKNNIPNIGNMIYNKNFWKIKLYDEHYNDYNILSYKWLLNRPNTVSYTSSLYFGFTYVNNLNKTEYVDYTPLPFDLKLLLDKETKLSF